VRLRRHQDGNFKGSVFVEFNDEESAKQFLDMEEKPKFNDRELEIMSKKAYVDGKVEAINNGTVAPKSPRQWGEKRSFRGNSRGRGGDRGGRGGRGRDRRSSPDYGNKRKRNGDEEEEGVDSDNWRERRDKFQKGEDGSNKPAPKQEENASEDKEAKKETETEAGAAPKQEAAPAEAPAAAAAEPEKKAEETSA
jgi:lupus La protein